MERKIFLCFQIGYNRAYVPMFCLDLNVTVIIDTCLLNVHNEFCYLNHCRAPDDLVAYELRNKDEPR